MSAPQESTTVAIETAINRYQARLVELAGQSKSDGDFFKELTTLTQEMYSTTSMILALGRTMVEVEHRSNS